MRNNNSNKHFVAAAVVSLLLTLSIGPAYAAYTNIQTPEDKILSKGFQAYLDGRDKQAMSYFEEVVRINPKNKAAQKGLEKVKIRMKKQDDTTKSKALHLAKSRYAEGKQLLKTDDTIGAIDSFHAAMDAVPDYKPAKSQLNSIRKEMSYKTNRKGLNLSVWAYSRGVLAYLDRDWAKAYRIWSERSQLEPTNVALANASMRAENKFKRMMLVEQEDFFRRGARAFYDQGLYDQSRHSWSKVLAMRTDDQEAMEGLARSEDALLRAQGKGRDNEITDLLEQGLDHYASQNWNKALGFFQRIVELDPNFSTANEYIALINRKVESVAYIPSSGANDSWKRSRPSNESGNAVEVPQKLGNFDESKKELETQLKRDPANIRVQQELDKVKKDQEEESERIYKDGLIAYSQGNRSLAIEQWKQVLVINPDHKKAAAALRKARAEEERTANAEP